MTTQPTAARSLADLRHVALDLDGTLYNGSEVFPETVPFLALLRQLGIGYTFLTNNASKSRCDYLAHLERFGIRCEEAQIETSGHATQRYLHEHGFSGRPLFFVGSPNLMAEFAKAGFPATDGEEASPEPAAIVVAADPTLTYPKLCRAAWWITRGKPFIATNPDRFTPTNRPTVLPGCAATCAFLEVATGRRPDIVLGKPHPSMLTPILERHGLEPSQVAMVGDRLYTDIALAHRTGALGVLVLTGEATAADAESAPEPPDLVVAHLGELGRHLADAL
ncbi:MAG TPA: HAD-IIA family hydrolase [Chthoniobacteraceae bacterium]|nr:HAD-IIA family hydrolase [Chthoniobacteraceae bacterium]